MPQSSATTLDLSDEVLSAVGTPIRDCRPLDASAMLMAAASTALGFG